MKNFSLLSIAFFLGTILACAQPTQAPDRYTPELLWKLGRVSEPVVSPDGSTVLYGVTWYDLQANKGNRDLYTIPLKGGEAKKVTSETGSEVNGIFRPDGKKIAYLSAKSGSMQVWEADLDGSNPVQMTDVQGDIGGFSYSPDMKNMLYILRIKLDKTPADIYPDLPKANVRIEDDLMYRHWDSWSDYSYNHIFIAPYSGNKITTGHDIMVGERYDSPMLPWGGMEQINWSSDGKRIAYTCKKLTGKDYSVSTNSQIYIFNVQKMELETVLGEAGYDQDPVFSPDNSKLVWRSMERDGFEADKDRIFIYNFNDKSIKNYSQDFDQNAHNFVWSADGKTLNFLSEIYGTVQIYQLDPVSGKIKKITDGMHDYTSLAVAQGGYVATRMSMLNPVEIFYADLSGTARQLTHTNDKILSGVKSAKVEGRWLTTSDNKKMLTWVIYPPDFDARKVYPTLLFCEGGPQSMVSQFFSYRWNFQIMAANDYIVVAPNRRGLPGFGQEWNDQISGDYGGQNMLDYFTAIDSLAKEPYVNKDKLGAVGASYGGFSVLWLAGHHEKRFKAFISHCGMFNLEDQYLTTEEMWFVNWDLGGPYWEKGNKAVDHSFANSPHRFVDKWDTPILVIEGEQDFRIPFTQGMAAYNAANLRGIPAKYLHFPEENHWILKPQNSVLWQREFFSWLDMYLK